MPLPLETTAVHDFISARVTQPDPVTLLTAIRTATSDLGAIVIQRATAAWSVKKATQWTAPQIAAVQSAIDASAAATPQLTAQHLVDSWPIEYKALVLALIDALNVVRSKLPTPLVAITPEQAIGAIRDKAGTL